MRVQGCTTGEGWGVLLLLLLLCWLYQGPVALLRLESCEAEV